MKKNINNPEDLEKIKIILTNYTLVFDRHISIIPTYSKIKYIDKKTGEFSHGGQYMKITGDNLLLKIYTEFKSILWNLKYQDSAIYIEDLEQKKNKRKQKNNLYKLYDAGLLKLVD